MKQQAAIRTKQVRLGGFRREARTVLPPLPGREADPAMILVNFQKTVVTRCRKYKKALKRCRESFSQESVHELRVETRRFLALIALLKPYLSVAAIARGEKRFRKIFKRLAVVRDVQVQLEHFRAQERAQPEMGHFCRVLVKRKRRTIARLRSGFSQARVRKVKRALRMLRREADLRLASAKPKLLARDSIHALDRAFAKVANLRARPDALDVEIIHRTRVAFKKFRYALEILRPILTDIGQDQLRRLQFFQTLMGEIQDIEMFEKAITRFSRNDPGKIKQFRRFRASLRLRHSELISHYAEATEELLHPFPPNTRGKRSRVALN